MNSHATVPTAFASRYLQQLCKHWSHKAETAFTPQDGRIAFASGNVLELHATDSDLSMAVTVPAGEDPKYFQDVVEKHLLRFSFREEISINWTDGEPPGSG